MSRTRWDIFCRVIDNYGDAAVCWRLARQLVAEHHLQVRLWIDDLAPLGKLWPEVSLVDQQQVAGVQIRLWSAQFPAAVEVADVVIEAFACHLPDSYIALMRQCKASTQQPYWFNLEYLSAESWTEGYHGLVSAHPATGLQKYFFMPGFAPQTGGLLAERGLLSLRQAFLTDSATRLRWLLQRGIQIAPQTRLISLFAYENAATGSLVSSWENSPVPICCLVPEGKILASLSAALQQNLAVGDVLQRGQLRIQVLPFLDQDSYDSLLWSCDLNFVRGEDSLVRAIWAGRPFVWQLYPQDDGAHLVKMEAFLARYCTHPVPAFCSALQAFWRSWNQQQDCLGTWQSVMAQITHWQEHSQQWSQAQNSLPDLASNMVHFCQKTL